MDKLEIIIHIHKINENICCDGKSKYMFESLIRTVVTVRKTRRSHSMC